MTGEELLSGAIVDTGIIIQGGSGIADTSVGMSFGDPQLLKGIWGLFKGLFLAIRPFIKRLLVLLVVLLILYICVLFLFSYLTSRKRKKVKDDIPPEYKEYKEIGKEIIVSNMYNYGDVYDPEYELEMEKELQKEKDLQQVEDLKKTLDTNQPSNDKKVIL